MCNEPVSGQLASQTAIAILRRSFFAEISAMASNVKPGGNVRVTISKSINRDSARKTIERLFMMDKTVAGPIDARSVNFKDLPKRRGGCIWTKRPNKLHPKLDRGASATIKATPQHLRDLKSVEAFVEVKSA